jgi:hypothetical protein
MVTLTSIKRLKAEYKAYLTQQHPDWSPSTVSTYVSDAFYANNHDIVPSFWSIFESDADMESACADILEFLSKEVESSNASVRAQGYANELKMLKAFIDTKGGIRKILAQNMTPKKQYINTVKKYLKNQYLLWNSSPVW